MAAPFQLVLFATGWLPIPPVMIDLQREKRSGDQWIRSILDYCYWRAGDCWRNLTFRDQRMSPQRWDYLRAARLVSGLRYYVPPAIELVLPALPSLEPSPPKISQFDLLSRPQLVDALLDADPSLSDRKLLSHLARTKLAAMLARALEARPAKTGRIA